MDIIDNNSGLFLTLIAIGMVIIGFIRNKSDQIEAKASNSNKSVIEILTAQGFQVTYMAGHLSTNIYVDDINKKWAIQNGELLLNPKSFYDIADYSILEDSREVKHGTLLDTLYLESTNTVCNNLSLLINTTDTKDDTIKIDLITKPTGRAYNDYKKFITIVKSMSILLDYISDSAKTSNKFSFEPSSYQLDENKESSVLTFERIEV